MEFVFLKIMHLNRKTVVGSICRPSNTNFRSFNSFFYNLPSMVTIMCNIINRGVFKLYLIQPICYSVLLFHYDIRRSSNSLMSVIARPTRFSANFHSLSDNIFISNLNNTVRNTAQRNHNLSSYFYCLWITFSKFLRFSSFKEIQKNEETSNNLYKFFASIS